MSDAMKTSPQAVAAPALDAALILRRCCGDAQFAAAVIEQFRKQVPLELNHLEKALAAGDADAFGRAAHTIKSMAAYVTADAAAQLSRALEELGRSNRLAEAAPLLRRLGEEIGRVVACVAQGVHFDPAPRAAARQSAGG